MSRIAAIGVAVAVCLVPVPAAAAAQADAGPGGGRDVISASGLCADGSTWVLAARSRALRILLVARIGSAQPGHRWRLRLAQNGQLVARGNRRVNGKGELALRRATPNLAGVDTFTIVARNRTTGESCRGTLDY